MAYSPTEQLCFVVRTGFQSGAIMQQENLQEICILALFPANYIKLIQSNLCHSYSHQMHTDNEI